MTPARRAHFGPGLFAFLAQLERHNDRAWFDARRARYEAEVREPMLAFIADLGPGLKGISPCFLADPRPVGGSMFRIYRDTRFSADKSPYKTHAAAHFPHRDAGKDVHAPGFYLHLEPGASFAGGGLWRPDSAALRRVRDAIVARPAAWRAVRRRVGEIEGDRLSRVPRGYDADHPLADDLMFTDFYTSVGFTDDEVLAPGFLGRCIRAFRTASPLVEFLTKAVGLRWRA
ncbi:MAG TPA: DUF2461 domain-containing protein [Thermodesulfobacteriota bacterium]